jgi:hypothetical protein
MKKRLDHDSLLIAMFLVVKPLMPELKPSAQRCLTRFFTGDFAS